MKVLWADDQLDVAKTLANCLQPLNCDIDFVASGDEALIKLKNNDYQIVLTDLAMPPNQWGGLWLIEEIKKLTSHPKIIVVSGEGSQAETIKALRLGANDYVTKENITDELPKQILSILENSEKKQDIKSIILSGETAKVEFKSTLRYNINAKKNDPNIELASFKTIAGFLNSDGGTLFIGVDDSSQILGLDLDNFPNTDKFQLHFWNIFRQALGAETSDLVKAEIVAIEEKTIFQVTCKASNHPIFLKWKMSGESNHQEIFYVRAGPQTELLNTKQVIVYIQDHYKP